MCKEKAHLSCVMELFQLCLRCTSAAYPNMAEIVLDLYRYKLCLHPFKCRMRSPSAMQEAQVGFYRKASQH